MEDSMDYALEANDHAIEPPAAESNDDDARQWPEYNREAPLWLTYFSQCDPGHRDPQMETKASGCIWWMGKKGSHSVTRYATRHLCLDEKKDNGRNLFYYKRKRYSARLLLFGSMAQGGFLGPDVITPRSGQRQKLKSSCKNHHCVNPHHHQNMEIKNKKSRARHNKWKQTVETRKRANLFEFSDASKNTSI